MRLSGLVGGPDFNLALVNAAIKQAKGRSLRLQIASEGGHAAEALAIYNTLRAYRGEVIVEVEWAGSAGSLVAMAADRRAICVNGWFCVHQTWAITWGTPAEIRAAAEVFAATEQRCLEAYMRCGLPEADVRQLMQEARPMNPEAAVAQGFCGEVLPTECDAPETPKYQSENHASLAKIKGTIDQASPENMRRLLEDQPREDAEAVLSAAALYRHILANTFERLRRAITGGRVATKRTGELGIRWRCPSCEKWSYTSPAITPDRPQPCPFCAIPD